MRYREHLPAPPLRRAVACYWSLRGQAAANDPGHRVLPDGSLDILFDVAAGDAQVIGVMTRAIVSEASGAVVDLVGVRFRPGEAASFLGVAARETRDRALGLRDVCGAWGRETAERLAHDTTAEDFDARAAILDAALLERRRRQPADARVRAALFALCAGALALGDVALRANLSERQLERLFDDHVGIGPKLFARVARMQALVRAVDDAAACAATVPWAATAVALGYVDQAHLIRDVRALTGVTPAVLLRERRAGVLGAASVSEMSNPPAAILGSVEG